METPTPSYNSQLAQAMSPNGLSISQLQSSMSNPTIGMGTPQVANNFQPSGVHQNKIQPMHFASGQTEFMPFAAQVPNQLSGFQQINAPAMPFGSGQPEFLTQFGPQVLNQPLNLPPLRNYGAARPNLFGGMSQGYYHQPQKFDTYPLMGSPLFRPQMLLRSPCESAINLNDPLIPVD